MMFTKTISILSLSLFSFGAYAIAEVKNELDPKFFANKEIQRTSPHAFALQPEAHAFLKTTRAQELTERLRFLQAIETNTDLVASIHAFSTLSWESKLGVLKKVFELEVKSLGIEAPELIIQSDLISGPAYFDFDVTKSGSGRVILNPSALEKEADPYLSLNLLIHETRHSAQFQLAFDTRASMPPSELAQGFQAAFRAQKELKGRLSYIDFCTLLNEYEAFQFGNFVLGNLLGWEKEFLDMGTFASQYQKDGLLRIDLLQLFEGNQTSSILDRFNELEWVQYRLLKP